MKILITGFEPFGGETVNPSWEAVKCLPERIGGAELIRAELPTSFAGGPAKLERLIGQHTPDFVISVGQAGGRPCVTLEQVAVNLANAGIPDNDGAQPAGESLQENGAAAYFSTLPLTEAVKHVRSAGLPCHISYTAGTYVCNAVMYRALFLADSRYPKMRAGFVHVPYTCEQTVEKPYGTPCMSQKDIVRSLTGVVETCAACFGEKTDERA